VLAVTSGQRLGFVPVENWLAKVPPDGWRRLSAGDGAKGPRLYDWAYLPFRGAAPGWRMGLLIRRSPAKPDDLAYHLTHAPEGTTLAELVRVAARAGTIESCFEAAKGEVGLDEYEVRSWVGWHRPRHARHAGARLPRRAAQGRPRGERTSTTSPSSCCRSPCPRCGACSGASSGISHPDQMPCSTGQPGAGAINNAPAEPTGIDGTRHDEARL
jgi:hypothetical protein